MSNTVLIVKVKEIEEEKQNRKQNKERYEINHD